MWGVCDVGGVRCGWTCVLELFVCCLCGVPKAVRLWSRSEVVLRCADGLLEGCGREPAKKILYLIKTLNRQNCDFKARLAKPNNRDEPSITSVNKYNISQHKASFNDVHNSSMIN